MVDLSFEDAVRERYKLSDTMKAMKERVDELSDYITSQLMALDVKRAAVGDLVVSYVESKNTRIDRKLLLEHGVTADQIVNSTVSTPYTYVQIKRAE